MICFKEALTSDLDLVMEWRMRVLAEVFELQGNEPFLEKLRLENERYYRSSLADGTHQAWFMLEDNRIIGCGGLCFYDEMPSPDTLNGHCAYLMNIFVVPQRRKHGNGRKLVMHLIDQAIKAECEKITLETSLIAKPLYLSLGFEPMKWNLQLNFETYQRLEEETGLN